ncbi:MAG: TolC family protein [Bacteroidetes bacterium]|nr:TolC family protein [Bacteroidota bacterium]
MKTIKITLAAILILALTASAQETHRLTLDEAINTALANNPLVKAKMANVKAAESKIEQARSYEVPTVNLMSQYFYANNLPGMFLQGPNQIPVMSSNGPVSGEYVITRPMAPFADENRDVFTTDINLVYPLYTGGKISKANENAGILKEAATSDLDEQKDQLVLNVTTAFDNVLLLEQVIDVNKQALVQFEKHLELAKQAYANGVRSEFDVLTFESKVDEFKAKLVDLEGKLDLAESGLKSLLALPISEKIECTGELQLPDSTTLADSVGAYSYAVAHNYQLKTLRLKKQMLENLKTITAAGMKPTIFLFGNYHVYHGMDFPPYDNAWRNGLAAGIRLSMPIFNGNLTKGKLEEVNASESMVDDYTEGMTLKLKFDIKNVLITIQNLRAKLSAEEVHLGVAKKAHEIAKVSYENGIITPVELNDAEVQVAAIQTSILNYQKDILLAYAELDYLESK